MTQLIVVKTQNIKNPVLKGAYVLAPESDGTYRVTIQETSAFFGYYHPDSYGGDFAGYLNSCYGGVYVKVIETTES